MGGVAGTILISSDVQTSNNAALTASGGGSNSGPASNGGTVDIVGEITSHQGNITAAGGNSTISGGMGGLIEITSTGDLGPSAVHGTLNVSGGTVLGLPGTVMIDGLAPTLTGGIVTY